MKYLRPGDVIAAAQIGLTPRLSVAAYAENTGRSIGDAHNAIARLRLAGLVDPADRVLDVQAFVRFVQWGVATAYAAVPGPVVTGFAIEPTSSGATQAEGGGPDRPGAYLDMPFVWPSARGNSRGTAVAPLHQGILRVITTNPQLVELARLIDITRLGGDRTARAVADRLRTAFAAP
ncbi:MAG: hypothetical protein FJ202_00830 [Gemmatimonadetes bacterium]|nr:hypothetical protein [Gemmatimonadota bacterium]